MGLKLEKDEGAENGASACAEVVIEDEPLESQQQEHQVTTELAELTAENTDEPIDLQDLQKVIGRLGEVDSTTATHEEYRCSELKEGLSETDTDTYTGQIRDVRTTEIVLAGLQEDTGKDSEGTVFVKKAVENEQFNESVIKGDGEEAGFSTSPEFSSEPFDDGASMRDAEPDYKGKSSLKTKLTKIAVPKSAATELLAVPVVLAAVEASVGYKHAVGKSILCRICSRNAKLEEYGDGECSDKYEEKIMQLKQLDSTQVISCTQRKWAVLDSTENKMLAADYIAMNKSVSEKEI
ncbi:unnamed protein product [Gongylonema pulchrum]|uniref:WIYLD domain-containing protein n=1 Tax=Gongylonema pulchrum TaxID=637853 RepID=A0A183E750_9BILA|nr:unnamed protein product [Gongylonema pulchrum]